MDGRGFSWEERFDQLAAFHARHGHAQVPRFAPKPPGLGQWLANQRRFLAAGRLTRDQRRKLAALGVSESARADAWDHRFAEFARFVRKQGRANVPLRPRTPLAKWVAAQRAAARRGRLSTARRERLARLGFVWNAKAVTEAAQWDAMFERLKAFRRKHGHCDVPVRAPRDGSLTHWVVYQRAQARAGKLPAARRARLEAIRFAWNAKDAHWDERFHQAVEHRAATGGWTVRSGSALQKWMSEQRARYHAGTLRAERRAKLNAVGFDWAPQPPRIDSPRRR